MTKHLDPKFAKIVALMNSTVHEEEKVAARQRAEAVVTLEQRQHASDRAIHVSRRIWRAVHEGIDRIVEKPPRKAALTFRKRT